MRNHYRRTISIPAIAALILILSACGGDDSLSVISLPTPIADDYIVSNLFPGFDGNPKAITITPKSGKSEGEVTVYYEGTGITNYSRRTAAPSGIGLYMVTFDVAATSGFNAGYRLFAGVLDIDNFNPDSDFGFNAGTGTINAYYSSGSPLVRIPLTINGVPVTAIRDQAFYKSAVASVAIPDSVKSIGDGAFYQTANLRRISMGQGIESIGNYAFYQSGLDAVFLPEGLQSIGDWAFSGCKNLTSIIIPPGVQSIGDSAFSLCESLISVTLSDGLTSIGGRAFDSCEKLANINLPDSIVSIEAEGFNDCGSLTSIVIPAGMKSLEYAIFLKCGGLTGITIPAGIEKIGDYAVGWCLNLSSVTFEATITAANFSETESFYGDLRAKYLANPDGGPGTYTTANPGEASTVWTKQ